MKLYTTIFFIAILSTGFMSGIFFTWSNAVTPGIGKLENMTYLSSLQSMNCVILNPLFYISFGLPVISLLILTVIGYRYEDLINNRLILTATVIYFFGVFLVTLLGNIPLNKLLDQSDLASISAHNADQLRATIENKWNQFNLIRTLSSLSSFIMLLITCFNKIN